MIPKHSRAFSYPCIKHSSSMVLSSFSSSMPYENSYSICLYFTCIELCMYNVLCYIIKHIKRFSFILTFNKIHYPYLISLENFVTEMSIRPEPTHAISSASRGMTAEDVAKKIMHGIMAKNFTVFCNFEGFMLCLGTAGMSPQRSWLMALAEIFGSGIMRLVAICYQYKWSKTISKCHSKKNIKQPHIV